MWQHTVRAWLVLQRAFTVVGYKTYLWTLVKTGAKKVNGSHLWKRKECLFSEIYYLGVSLQPFESKSDSQASAWSFHESTCLLYCTWEVGYLEMDGNINDSCQLKSITRCSTGETEMGFLLSQVLLQMWAGGISRSISQYIYQYVLFFFFFFKCHHCQSYTDSISLIHSVVE